MGIGRRPGRRKGQAYSHLGILVAGGKGATSRMLNMVALEAEALKRLARLAQ